MVNTIFCDECGHYLLGEENRETDPLDTQAIGWVGGPIKSPQVGTWFQPNGQPPIIYLKIGNGRREVKILLDKFISLGRIDPTANIFPEIDLSTDGDLAVSVSRRHAGIFYHSGTIVIEDQASANGTFVNGARLAPYLPEALNDGDLLQLGKLLIEVKIE
ncbi:MAG: FHA domain-containing protein [Chloroflexi bacterium]|nr:FHA domain-containing protein [Chloroflexota bacterium]